MYNFVEKNYFKLHTLYMEEGSVTIRYGGLFIWDSLFNIPCTAFQYFIPGGNVHVQTALLYFETSQVFSPSFVTQHFKLVVNVIVQTFQFLCKKKKITCICNVVPYKLNINTHASILIPENVFNHDIFRANAFVTYTFSTIQIINK